MMLVLITPALNEAAFIGTVVDQAVAAGYPVVVVDDGSTDRTALVAREAGATVLRQPFNLRVGAALRADALVMGEVDKCSTYRYRQHNNSKVSLRVRMADTATGESFWQGGIVIDDMGLPHEVATRGITLLLDQLASRTRAARPKKDDSMKRLFKQ